MLLLMGYGSVGYLLHELVSLLYDSSEAAYFIAVPNKEYLRTFIVGVCIYECSYPVILFSF